MQEAFRRAEEKLEEQSPTASPFRNVILRRAYGDLGNSFFSTVVVPYYGRGKFIQVPVFEYLHLECLELHPKLVARTIPDRAYILEGFTNGLRVSEQKVDPAYEGYLNLFKRVVDEDTIGIQPYSRPSQLFLFGLTLLYGVKSIKDQKLMDFLANRFHERLGRDIISLPQVRVATAEWLSGTNF